MSRIPGFARLITAIPRTFLSDAVYREAARSWRGTGLLYLFVLLTLASAPMAVGMVYNLKGEIQAELPYFLASFPPLKMAGGRLSLVEGEPPVVLNLQGQEAVIIDPSGTTGSLEGTSASVLVTDRDLRIRWIGNRELSLGFKDVEDMSIGKDEVRTFVEEALSLFPVVLLPFAYLTVLVTSLLWWVVQALFYAMVGTMLLFRGELQPPFNTCLRLTCLALTPAVAVRALFTVLLVTSAWAELFIVVIEVAYVFQAFKNGINEFRAARTDHPDGP